MWEIQARENSTLEPNGVGRRLQGVRPSTATLGALVIGSVIVADPAGWSPFGPAKWLVISTLGLLGGAATLCRPGRQADRATWWLWFGLIALVTVSALVNGDVVTALFGHPSRHLGVVTWLLMWLLFTAGQRLGRRDQRVIATACVAAAVAMGSYAVVEAIFGRPIGIDIDSERLTGPYGSASFLGAASCLLLPVCVGVVLDIRRSATTRCIAACAAAATAVALLGSGARAAWLGLFLAFVVTSVVGRAEPARRLRTRLGQVDRRALAAGALGSVVVLTIAVTFAMQFRDVVERDHGAASRLDEWTVAATVIGDHPVLGVGPEGYRNAVVEGIDADYERAYGRNETTPDRAHSGPLDVALAGGVLAASAYVVLFAFVGRRALRLMRDGDPLRRWLAIGVVAYGVQQLFLFPLAEIDPVWWLLNGVVVTAGRPRGIATRSTSITTTRASTSTRSVAVVASLVAVIAFAAGVLDVAADRLAKRSLQASADGDSEAAVRAIERAVDLRPDVITYRLVAAQAHLQRGTVADIDAAIDESRAALRWSPNDPMARDQLASALLQRAVVTGTEVDRDAAMAAWRGLAERDPNRARWQFQYGRAALLDGQVEIAELAWATAASLDPTNAVVRALLDELSNRE